MKYAIGFINALSWRVQVYLAFVRRCSRPARESLDIRNIALIDGDQTGSIARLARLRLRATKNRELFGLQAFCHRTRKMKMNFVQPNVNGTRSSALPWLESYAISLMEGVVITGNPLRRQWASIARGLEKALSLEKPSILVLNADGMTHQPMADYLQSLSSSLNVKLIPIQALNDSSSFLHDILSNDQTEHLTQRRQMEEELAQLDDEFLLSLGSPAIDIDVFLSVYLRIFQKRIAIPVLFDRPQRGVERLIQLLPFLLPAPASFPLGTKRIDIISSSFTNGSRNEFFVKVTGDVRSEDQLVNARDMRNETVGTVSNLGENSFSKSILRHGDVGIISGFASAKVGDILVEKDALKVMETVSKLRFPSKLLLDKPLSMWWELPRRRGAIFEKDILMEGLWQFHLLIETQESCPGENLIRVNSSSGSATDTAAAEMIRRGLEDALRAGPLLGAPIAGLRVSVSRLEWAGDHSCANDSQNVTRKVKAVLRTNSGLFQICEPIMRLEITTPTSFSTRLTMTGTSIVSRPWQIEKDLLQLGGSVLQTSVDLLHGDVIIKGRLPLRRRSPEVFEFRLAEMSRGAAFCQAELDSFEQEDIFSNDDLSPFAEFVLTPLLDLRESELIDSSVVNRRLADDDHDEHDNRGVNKNGQSDSKKDASFVNYTEYRRRMSLCFLHEVAASIVKSYGEITSDEPRVPLEVMKIESSHRALQSITARIPSSHLLAIAGNPSTMKLLTQERSIALIDVTNEDSTSDRVLACVSGVCEKDDHHFFTLEVRRSSMSSYAGTQISFQRFHSLLSRERQFDALLRLATSPIRRLILQPGSYAHSLSHQFEIGINSHRYNENQKVAIANSVWMTKNEGTSPKMSIIHGPPGTGKSHVIVRIVGKIFEDVEVNQNSTGALLLCAPSNVAVDQLLIRLMDYFRGKPSVPIMVRWGRDDKIDDRVKHLKPTGTPSDIHHSFMNADIIACTLNSAGTTIMTAVGKEKKIRCLIMDEASQGAELDAIIPMVNFDTRRLILVGDHLQLPPVVFSRYAREKGYHRSIFERFIQAWGDFDDGSALSVLLNEQYRMHPEIASFPMRYFYDGKVVTHQRISGGHDGLVPYLFLDQANGQEMPSLDFPGSFYNTLEARAVKSIVDRATRSSVCSSIGIITPYRAQQQLINRVLSLGADVDRDSQADSEPSGVRTVSHSSTVTVATVDAFQGGERDLIILSAVRARRSATPSNIGFLSDPRRLNVALTRAKKGLYIVGSAATLRVNPHWRCLIEDARARGALVILENADNFDGRMWQETRETT